jgi:hypothetical protein
MARFVPSYLCLLAVIGSSSGGFPALATETPAPDSPGALTRLELLAPTVASEGTNQALHLRGADARQQLLATASFNTGLLRDYTREVRYEISPAGVVQVSKTGRVTPLAEGTATITVQVVGQASRLSEGRLAPGAANLGETPGSAGQKPPPPRPSGLATATLAVTVEDFKNVPTVNFPNQIVPIFTKAGCNSGGCHGKASGQNGFKLSLLGFEPKEDYEHLTMEARGRRLFPAAPDRSLLLLKPTATLPHGGGKRLDVDSDDYKLLLRWIAQGMPYGKPTDPTVAKIEVFPKERTIPLDGEQQLAVVAHYTDGTTEDVTRSALYEPNDKNLAKCDETGLVKVFALPGDVAVMVRYQARVAVFRATIPLGAPVENVPVAKNFIDELVFKKLKTVGMPPSVLCDDSTFIRRSCIDIAGRLPTAEETKRFLADKDPAKREKWIDALLDSTDYAEYFANKWSALLRNKRGAPTHTRGTYAFYDWIRDSFLRNKPYDRFAREIVAASGELTENPPVAWYRQVSNPNAQLEDTAQLFLGLRLQCAQCHHHPFEKWSQQDYYGFAAFFSQVGRKAGAQPGEEIIYARRGVPTATNKKTKQPVPPAGLGEAPVKLSSDDDPRQALADWMSSTNNPFFAKALVNRYWKHFFNRGLVDPEDDMRETNPPTNPELLDALAKNFIASHFDLKNLVRTLCRSQVYQLSSLPNKFNAVDKQYFSRYYPKRLTAEVLLDAVDEATRSDSKFDGLPAGTRAVQLPDNSFNSGSYFLAVFGRPDSSSSCECERSQDASLAQSLHLLNSKEVQDKLTSTNGCAALLAKDTQREDALKVRELYNTVYSREPDKKELELALNHLGKSPVAKDGKADPKLAKQQGYEDIIWALINTKEFLFNH